MIQLISRFKANCERVEILTKDGDIEYFKEVNIDEYIKLLKKYKKSESVNCRNIKDVILFDDDYLGVGSMCKIIKQNEHTRIVTYKDKSYKISFPNSIYVIYHDSKRIKEIDAYCYKKFEGKETKLYKYPFPNMLYGNKICIGSAPKEIVDGKYIETLEKIIFTQYTHSNVDHIKSFKDTITYFEYLEHNMFPYDLLISLERTIESLVNS